MNRDPYLDTMAEFLADAGKLVCMAGIIALFMFIAIALAGA